MRGAFRSLGGLRLLGGAGERRGDLGDNPGEFGDLQPGGGGERLVRRGDLGDNPGEFGDLQPGGGGVLLGEFLGEFFGEWADRYSSSTASFNPA